MHGGMTKESIYGPYGILQVVPQKPRGEAYGQTVGRSLGMRGLQCLRLLQRLDNYLTEVLGATVHVDLGGQVAIDGSMICKSRPFIRRNP